MKNGVVTPKFFNVDEGDAKTSGAHWSQSVQSVLMSELGYGSSEVLNMPLSKALSDYYKWAEKSGMVALMTDDELADVEELEKQGELELTNKE